MKNITIKSIKEKGPCKDGLIWLRGLKTLNPREIVDSVKTVDQAQYVNWGFSRFLSVENRVKYAIFAAELVLPIFETRFPDDNRPRKAIEAAKSGGAYAVYAVTRAAAYAADAADATLAAAYAAYAADAADAAIVAATADAADAAIVAATAAADAAAIVAAAIVATADAADAYAAKATGRDELDTYLKIFAYGLELLEKQGDK